MTVITVTVSLLLMHAQLVNPLAAAFGPDVVIVSAGFDATEGDPLGRMKVSPAGSSSYEPAMQIWHHMNL